MIRIKSTEEIKKMRIAGKLTAQLLNHLETMVKAGVSTGDLNRASLEFIAGNNAKSATLGYRGFPGAICTSLNNVVCHGIPRDDEILKEGDIINIDVTLIVNGYHGDLSKTFIVGSVPDSVRTLVETTERAMHNAIDTVKHGKYLYEIGKAVEKTTRPFGYSIVREYGGHGIGKDFHEEPHVFHYFSLENKIIMKKGMVFTIEPMINMGTSYRVITSKIDGWTVTTQDGSLSAQFEHTVLVTDDGCEILTLP